jgi:hypothetical protein
VNFTTIRETNGLQEEQHGQGTTHLSPMVAKLMDREKGRETKPSAKDDEMSII